MNVPSGGRARLRVGQDPISSEDMVLKVDPLENPDESAPKIAFRRCPSVGVEEEFLLHDTARGMLAPRAPELLTRLADAVSGACSEMQNTQIELVTEPETTLEAMATGLLRNREQASAAASEMGLRLLPAGMPPQMSLQAPPARASIDDSRYRKIFARYGAAAERYQGCGTHVHVEVPDRETAVAVLGHLTPWLPLLVALGGNSAYAGGADTRFSSWRIATQRRFPVSGLPPEFRSATHYDETVDALVDAGLLEDGHTCFWLARLSDRYPTIEIRASDVGLTADDSVLQAALGRALVMTALSDLEKGHPPPTINPMWGDAAVWTAARHGLEGPALDPFTGRKITVSEYTTMLLDKTTDALCEAGDYYAVRTLLAALKKRGSGAQLQRCAARGGHAAVTSMLHGATCQAAGLGRNAGLILNAAQRDWSDAQMENEQSKSQPETTPPAEDQTNLVHEEHDPDTGSQPKVAGGAIIFLTAAIAIAFLIVAVYVGGQAFNAW
ncbi:carboxylate-amine ligase [Hoyosella subflava]|uniref:carboxylate-amine ligase n=1 Tax=Hoyosella subflava TaxID=639313 RepID=UPI0009FD60F5|nr:YbdK family carboxylate-amine ligase [Hoyosella subflava]